MSEKSKMHVEKTCHTIFGKQLKDFVRNYSINECYKVVECSCCVKKIQICN